MAETMLTEKQRVEVLEKISQIVRKRFYDASLRGIDWPAAVKRHRGAISSASCNEEFELAMMALLAELKSSHVGFFHRDLVRATSKMAICATYAPFAIADGERWIFQDVHEGGPAADAGIRPGDILIAVAGRSFRPPEHPIFSTERSLEVDILAAGFVEKTVTLHIPAPKRKFQQLPYVEPHLVLQRRLRHDLGYLKISMYPGIIGIEVANAISDALGRLNPIKRLIVDLRGNTGGGLAHLRVMSLLTPDQLPVGYFRRGRLVRSSNVQERALIFNRIPTRKRELLALTTKFLVSPALQQLIGRTVPIMLATEGCGPQPFHHRVVLLVDRHTASANEMLIAFARENNLAVIVGEATPGRVLAGSAFKLSYGYRLAIPVGAYETSAGSAIEGSPIMPDVSVPFDPEQARAGTDVQLQKAIEVVSKL